MSNNFLIHCFFNLKYLNIQILYENVVKLYKKKQFLGGTKIQILIIQILKKLFNASIKK